MAIKRKEIIRNVSEIRVLTFLFLTISFLPLEATCVPGNIMLFISPFVILAVRYRFAGKVTKNDLMYAGVFVVMILFVTFLANITNCEKTYGVTSEIPREWKTIQIDHIDAAGTLFIKTTRTVPVMLSDISIFVDDVPKKCTWDTTFPNFIAPGQTKACYSGIKCSGTGDTLIEVVAPGNTDTAVC